MRKFLKILGICAILFVLFYTSSVVMLYTQQRTLMYKPPADLQTPDSVYEQVLIPTKGAPDLPSYYKPARSKKPTILAFHGNGENAGNQAGYLTFIQEAGYGLLLAEYRGYGGNKGETTKDGIYKDAQAALTWLNGQGIGNKDIIVLGLSLGSAPASYLAGTHADLLGGIFIVPFSSMGALAQSYYPLVPFMSALLKDS
ncbi:MAG: alpha/beta hydrolase, partial [Pseudobdellovibrionaceae bacterium]